MMMSLNEPQRQALGCIEDGLAGSDPRLASMLNIFSRLAADEEMPVREKIRVQRGRTAAHRRRRARWHPHPRRGIALPQAPRRYPRLGWSRRHGYVRVLADEGARLRARVSGMSSQTALLAAWGMSSSWPRGGDSWVRRPGDTAQDPVKDRGALVPRRRWVLGSCNVERALIECADQNVGEGN